MCPLCRGEFIEELEEQDANPRDAAFSFVFPNPPLGANSPGISIFQLFQPMPQAGNVNINIPPQPTNNQQQQQQQENQPQPQPQLQSQPQPQPRVVPPFSAANNADVPFSAILQNIAQVLDRLANPQVQQQQQQNAAQPEPQNIGGVHVLSINE
jgi:hypothetical protein